MADHLSRAITAAIRRIAGGHRKFAPFFSWLAEQPEGTRETELDTIESGAGLSRLQAVALCKQLQDASVGRSVAGRRGRASRIEWSADPRAIGAALAQADGVTRADEAEGPDSEELSPARTRSSSTLQRQAPAPTPAPTHPEREDEDQHLFRLRQDRQVRLSLPMELTQGEAARLADFVRALGLPEHDDGAVLGIGKADGCGPIAL